MRLGPRQGTSLTFYLAMCSQAVGIGITRRVDQDRAGVFGLARVFFVYVRRAFKTDFRDSQMKWDLYDVHKIGVGK